MVAALYTDSHVTGEELSMASTTEAPARLLRGRWDCGWRCRTTGQRNNDPPLQCEPCRQGQAELYSAPLVLGPDYCGLNLEVYAKNFHDKPWNAWDAAER